MPASPDETAAPGKEDTIYPKMRALGAEMDELTALLADMVRDGTYGQLPPLDDED